MRLSTLDHSESICGDTHRNEYAPAIYVINDATGLALRIRGSLDVVDDPGHEVIFEDTLDDLV